mmetsp:Transcript_33337/g.59719  ORF Transcript_33337/g.59719 Transcript_33337/m.59719 type:complete len:89 (-) Transcript_33337:12046-12312(-)
MMIMGSTTTAGKLCRPHFCWEGEGHMKNKEVGGSGFNILNITHQFCSQSLLGGTPILPRNGGNQPSTPFLSCNACNPGNERITMDVSK